jgi:uncharacterized membrane protein YvlD (DUF360 family)
MKMVIHRLYSTILGIFVMSIVLMYFVYSFDFRSIEFYIAIIQAIVMEFSIKWLLKKYNSEQTNK